MGQDDERGMGEGQSLTRPPGRRTEQSPRQQHLETGPAPQSPPPHPPTLEPRQGNVVEDDKRFVTAPFRLRMQLHTQPLTLRGLRVRVGKHLVLVAEHVIVHVELVGNGSLQTNQRVNFLLEVSEVGRGGSWGSGSGSMDPPRAPAQRSA